MIGLRTRDIPDAITVELAEVGPVSVNLKRNRQARRLILRFDTRTGQPTLTLPPGVALATARRFLDENHAFLRRGLGKQGPARALAEGVHVPLRGVFHRIAHDPSGRRAVRVADDQLLVGGPADLVGSRLLRWLKEEARHDLADRVAAHCDRLGRAPAPLTIRDTASRWGSCTSRGRLNFSWRLILAPPSVLDYVAGHEVAHLVHMNHSPAFWALVKDLVGDYRTPRAWLRHHGGDLMRYGPPGLQRG